MSCHISTSFVLPFTSIPNTLPAFFCVSVISLLSPCIEPAFVKSEPVIKLSVPSCTISKSIPSPDCVKYMALLVCDLFYPFV